MATQINIEVSFEEGVRIARAEVRPSLTGKLIEHLRGKVSKEFKVTLNAGSWDDEGNYDLFIINAEEGDSALTSFRVM